MLDKDIFIKSKPVNAFTRAQITTETTTYGAWIDTYGYNSILCALRLVITTGEVSAVTMQDADAADYSDVGTIPEAQRLFNEDQLPVDASAIIQLATVTKKRYVRFGVTTVNHGASVGMYVDGIAILSDAIYQPPADNSSINGADGKV